MKYTITLSSLAVATLVSAQVPDGCSTDFPGHFEYNPINLGSPLTPLPSEVLCTAEPYTTLKGGVLTDQCNRTGSIVANSQFQYDRAVQNNAFTTGGFSVCKNNTLAVAGSTIFYHCLSGDFYNLYDASIGAQCSPVYLQVIPCTLPSDVGSDCPGFNLTAPSSSSSSSSASSTSTSSSSTTTATSSPSVTSSASSVTAAVSSAPVTSTTAPAEAPPAAAYVVNIPYKYPSTNTTTVPAATGTGVVPVGTTATTSPIAFHGAASSLTMGGKLLVSAVGIAAVAFLA